VPHLIGGIVNEEDIMLLRGDKGEPMCVHEERRDGLLKQRTKVPLLQSKGYEEII
jgi:hypothetical protein